MHASVDLVAPQVELELEVEGVGEQAPGLEVAVDEAVTALERPLGLAVAGVEDHPARRELAAEGGEGVGRAPTARVDRPLAIPDQLLRQGAEPPKAAAHAPGDVGPLLREDERPGEGAREGQLAGDDPAPPGLAGADRDLPPRLAEVELEELAGR